MVNNLESYVIAVKDGGYVYEDVENGGVTNYRKTDSLHRASKYKASELDRVVKVLTNKIMFDVDYINEDNYELGQFIVDEITPFFIIPYLENKKAVSSTQKLPWNNM